MSNVEWLIQKKSEKRPQLLHHNWYPGGYKVSYGSQFPQNYGKKKNVRTNLVHQYWTEILEQGCPNFYGLGATFQMTKAKVIHLLGTTALKQ